MKSFRLFARLFRESVIMALGALVVNRLRTFLSILGISIGIFSIILVNTIVDSLQQNVMQSFDSLGSDVLYIQKWPWIFSDNYPWWKYMNRPENRIREADELTERLEGNPYVAYITFMHDVRPKTIRYLNNSVTDVGGIAVSQSYPFVNEVNLAKGRFFSDNESLQGRPVIILGHNIADHLFGDEDPLGKELNYYGRKLVVIGVIEKKGKSLLGSTEDDRIMIPVNFLGKLINLNMGYGEPSILVKAADQVSLDELEMHVRPAMRAIRRIRPGEEDDFSFNRITMLTQAIGSVFGSLKSGGSLIGIFALLVGGFGIANIMFVSVKERTGQIGIQKSLGAKNYFILFQFLTESVVLCILGGLLGLLLVYFLTLLMENIFPVARVLSFGDMRLPLYMLSTGLADFKLVLTPGNILYGNIISIVIGVVAGFIPAWNASQLDPVEAIRSKM